MKVINFIRSVRFSQKSGRYRRNIKAIACVVSASFFAPSVVHAQNLNPSTNTDFSSKIEEFFGRWTVLCLPRDAQRICAIRQVQVERDSRKPILLAELRVTPDNIATGGVMLPSDLRSEQGVRIMLDGNIAVNSLPIRDCSEKGCAVTVTFAGVALQKIMRGKRLQFLALNAQGTPQTHSIDLAGFKQTAERAMQLEYEAKPKQ